MQLVAQLEGHIDKLEEYQADYYVLVRGNLPRAEQRLKHRW